MSRKADALFSSCRHAKNDFLGTHNGWKGWRILRLGCQLRDASAVSPVYILSVKQGGGLVITVRRVNDDA